MPRRSRRPETARKAVIDFTDRYGWRAYALPVLALLTVVTLFRSGGGHNTAGAVAPHRTAPVTLRVTAGSATPTPPATRRTPTPAARTTVKTKPVTTKPVTTKPVTTKPATTKPATAKPAKPKPLTPKPVRTVRVAPDPAKPAARARERAQRGAASTPCHKNTAAREVVVSIAAQHAWMCARSALVYSSAVTTGRPQGHSTPTGTFKVQGNVKDATLSGSDYAVHVDYWIQFNGNIGFHDASWQTMAFGSDGYKTDGSRGCVHLPLSTVTWLHKWVQIGRTVVVVRKA